MDNSFKIDGTILAIDKTRPSKEGSTFMLRDFWIEQAIMGESNCIKFQLKGNNCDKIDSFIPGDEIIVHFSLLGTASTKDDKIGCNTNPKAIGGFSPNVNAWKIEFVPGFQRNPTQSQPIQQTGNAPQPNQNSSDPNSDSALLCANDLPF